MKNNKNVVIVLVIVILIGIGLFLGLHKKSPTETVVPATPDAVPAGTPTPVAKKTPPREDFKVEPADPSDISSNASIKKDTRTITSADGKFSFVVPYAWDYSLQKVNGCEDMTVVKAKQTGDVDIHGRIDIWPTDCMPNYISYQKQAEVGAYTIQVSNAEDRFVETGETAAVYKQILSTFKIASDNKW